MVDVKKLIEDAGGTIVEMCALPDDSGFATASFPLRKDHWIYDDNTTPPMPFRMGAGPDREAFAEKLREAGRYAVRGATMSGKESDFDPDALIQNLCVGALGYWTGDGLCHDPVVPDFDPSPVPPLYNDQPSMSAEVFGTLLWHLGRPCAISVNLANWLNDEALRHGFTDWRDAYDKLGRE